MKEHEIKKFSIDGVSMEATPLIDRAFQIFLKRMPTSSLTEETVKGYKSVIEQSVEIAQLFQKISYELLEEKK